MKTVCTIKAVANFFAAFSLLLLALGPVISVGAENATAATEGSLDTSFGTGGVVTTDFGSNMDRGQSAVLQPGGKIIVGGYAFFDTNADFALARYLPDGSLDPSFGGDGTVLTDFDHNNDLGSVVAVEPDGRILIAGSTYSMESKFALARYLPDGSLDASFGAQGRVTTALSNGDDYVSSMAIQPDGKIILGGTRQGSSTAFILVRYNDNGSLDKSFGVSGAVLTDLGQSEGVNDLVIQPRDGKIIAAGRVLKDDLFYLVLARYNSDGSLDTTFGTDGKVVSSVGTYEFSADLALQPDDKILVAGSMENSSADRDFVLLRYNSDGSPDTTFDSDGMVLTDFGSEDNGAAVVIQPDGRILMAGSTNHVTQFALARYRTDGSLDTGFGTDGKVITYAGGFSIAEDMLLQPDHKIIVVGSSNPGDNLNFAVARFINQNTPRTHYVRMNAAGANTGASWADAFTDLQSAIAAAANGDTIWVAAGTYKPTTGTDRTVSFNLKGDVKIYGGFAGYESYLSQRKPATNLTVLSGDIGAAGVKDDNSYHVVVGTGTNYQMVLDGFTITGGYADGPADSPEGNGAGMYNVYARPIIHQVIFTGNEAVNGGGGGMYNSSGNINLSDVTFSGNSAGARGGGGLYNEKSNPVLNGVTFVNNSACCGGGMANYKSRAMMQNITFTGNTALDYGGGMYNRESSPYLYYVTFTGNQAASDGGGFLNDENSHPSVSHVTFTGNSAARGGGMSSLYSLSPSRPYLVDVTFRNNTANFGGGLYATGSPSLINVTLEGNTAFSDGGGFYDVDGNPSLSKVKFIRNSALGTGGGMFSTGMSTSRDVTFLENSSGDSGGGMYSAGSAWLVNLTFSGNSAVRGGGLFAYNHSLSPLVLQLSNATFYGNSAMEGGGLYNDNSDDSGKIPALNQVTFSGNTADLGSGIYNNHGPLEILSSILYEGNSGDEIHDETGMSTIDYSIVHGGYAGNGNLDADPKLSPLADNGGFTETMALQPGSPAIDAGQDTYCETNDQRGVARPQGSHCDMGAYEFAQGIQIAIGDHIVGNYDLIPGRPLITAYAGIQNGPVRISSPFGYRFFTSQQVIAGTSFNEMMGYPANRLTTEYWFPWYDNKSMVTWVLVGNASGSQTAAVDIYIGGIKSGSYTIPVGGRVTPRFPLQAGPVKVVSTNGVKIFASERTQYGPNSAFNEIMGHPGNQLTTEYWFPWYDNKSMATWILVGNPSSTSAANVDIYIGGVKRGSYVIPRGGKVTPRFSLQTGPVRVVSTNGVKIFTSERTLYGDSFNEVMGYPKDQLTTLYWFPWNDNVRMSTWILVGNPTTSTAIVQIYVAGVDQGIYNIPPGKQINPRFNLTAGPVWIESINGVKIFASERVLYKTSFNEVMGYPGDQLTTEYWFPWYDSTSMSTEILVASP